MAATRSLLLSAVLLAGCYSVDDVRKQPTKWTATYPVAFDHMANCLAAQMAGDYRVTPQIYQREQRAVLTLGSTHQVIAEFQIRQSGNGSIVEWRDMPSVFDARSPAARERADRCGRGA